MDEKNIWMGCLEGGERCLVVRKEYVGIIFAGRCIEIDIAEFHQGHVYFTVHRAVYDTGKIIDFCDRFVILSDTVLDKYGVRVGRRCPGVDNARCWHSGCGVGACYAADDIVAD